MVILGDEYEYVQEFGEGVDRLYEVMETAGLPQPEYRVEAFMLYATIRNTKNAAAVQVAVQDTVQVAVQDTVQDILNYCTTPRSRQEIQEFCKLAGRNNFRKLYLKPLLESGQLQMTLPDKPSSGKQKYVTVGTAQEKQP